YKLKKNGFRIPAEAHFSRDLTLQRESSKVKISESIRGEKKEVEKNLTFACDSVKIENEKEEVLDTQFVTTS
ncbi:MAG: hypothetical protein COS11_01665, partial [bacterium (Candidatus Ratteibacteria) CG01_land_8_20_14_3_00_40_19]